MSLTDYFNGYFEILPADTSDLVEEVLRLRYQVYCVERNFEDASHHTDCKERDLYDKRSVHCLIRHKLTGLYVAAVRLILPDPADYSSLFPMEKYCRQSFFDNVMPLQKISRTSLAEVSRFLISEERERQIVRASTFEAEEGSGYRRKDGLLCYLLLFGLFSAVIRMTTMNLISSWYVSVEPAFYRLLTRFGIHFTKIGPIIDYHGLRHPCIGSTTQILSRIRRYRPEIWHFLTEGGKLTHPSSWPAQFRHFNVNR
ncbi:MAG: PEP-CTERM/exosortase system-associated acyltransferase [Nitrospiria bacterium]